MVALVWLLATRSRLVEGLRETTGDVEPRRDGDGGGEDEGLATTGEEEVVVRRGVRLWMVAGEPVPVGHPAGPALSGPPLAPLLPPPSRLHVEEMDLLADSEVLVRPNPTAFHMLRFAPDPARSDSSSFGDA